MYGGVKMSYKSDIFTSELNTSSITAKKIIVNARNTIVNQIPQLPTLSGDGCRSIICKDGILIGYSQSNYMFLKIDANGNNIIYKNCN